MNGEHGLTMQSARHDHAEIETDYRQPDVCSIANGVLGSTQPAPSVLLAPSLASNSATEPTGPIRACESGSPASGFASTR